MSSSYYLGEGRAYGVGRVMLGLAKELALRYGNEVRFSSFNDSAELQAQLYLCAPELVPLAVEHKASSWERVAMRYIAGFRNLASGDGGWSPGLVSKISRNLWWRYDRGWKYCRRSGGKEWCQRASVVHMDSMHDLHQHTNPEKVLATVHDLIPHHEGDPRQAVRLRRLSDQGVSFITGSRFVSEDLKFLLPNCVDRIHWFQDALEECFKPSHDIVAQNNWLKRLGLKEDEPWFVAQTGQHRRKNLEGAVKAVHRLRLEQNVKFKLVLAGFTRGVEKNLDEALPSSIRWRDFTVMTGMLDDRDFSHIYAKAIALIFLSRAEGFGYAPLEAMGCGLPAVASNKTSVPEVIGDAGPVFDPDDLEGVCGELLKLWRDGTYRQERVRKSLEQASHFTWRKAASRVGDAWEMIASRK